MNGTRALSLALLASLASCAADEALKPAPSASETPVTPADAGVDAPDDADPGPRVREVFTRNPLGRSGGNLLVDGDFELSILPDGASGQNGWIAFASNGDDASILGETGGLCRSGLRCGLVKAGQVLFGRGTAAPDDAKHEVTLWAKPVAPEATDPCKIVHPRLISCDTFATLGTIRAPDAPEADGWCRFHGEGKSSRLGACLYVEVDADVVLDDALVVAMPGDAALPPILAETPAERARLDLFRRIVHGKTRFGRPPLPDAPPPLER